MVVVTLNHRGRLWHTGDKHGKDTQQHPLVGHASLVNTSNSRLPFFQKQLNLCWESFHSPLETLKMDDHDRLSPVMYCIYLLQPSKKCVFHSGELPFKHQLLSCIKGVEHFHFDNEKKKIQILNKNNYIE